MTVITRVVALTALAFATIPFATAHAVSSGSKSNTCSSSQFYYSKKDCCLPHGGPTSQPGKPTPTPTPPKGKSCPPTNWYWHEEQSCCVPKHPLPPTNPQPPQCGNGYNWQDATQCCVPTPSKPPHTTTPQPSKTPSYGGQGSGHGNGNGYGNGHGNGWKRAHTSRSVSPCPKGLDACPISGLISGDYECLDTQAELESCGGCTSIGEGQDCTAIKGAWNVGCDRGRCNVYTCFAGFKRSADGSSCIAI